MKRALGLGALLLGCISSIATEVWHTSCRQVPWPIDGATNVPLDETLSIAAVGDLVGLPRLADGVTLQTIDGVDVPFSVERGDGVVFIVPDEPLQPDQEYVLRGLDVSALESAHFQGSTYPSEPTRAGFSTGGEQTLLVRLRHMEALYLIYSEPIDPSTVAVAADGEPVELIAEDDHILRLDIDAGEADDAVLTLDGEPVEFGQAEFGQDLAFWQGSSSCW